MILCPSAEEAQVPDPCTKFSSLPYVEITSKRKFSERWHLANRSFELQFRYWDLIVWNTWHLVHRNTSLEQMIPKTIDET